MLLDRQVRRAAYRSGQFTVDEEHARSKELVGWWPLHSNARDYSRLQMHGTVSGDPQRVIRDAGNWGPSPVWDFDGTGDFITIGDRDELGQINSLTVSAWTVYEMATPANRAWWLVSKGNSPNQYDWEIYIDRYGGGPNFRAIIWNNTSVNLSIEGSTTTSANTLYHVCMVWDEVQEELHIYLNGVSDGVDTTAAFSGTRRNQTSQVVIGDREDGSEFEWDGWIGDVRIYNKPFSPAEVMELYLHPEDIVRPAQRYNLLMPEQAAAPAADVSAMMFGSVF